MNVHRIARSLGSVVLATTLLTGCSAMADKAGEKVAEKGMEAAGGGGVDIDSEGDGKVTIESDEGSLEVGGSDLPDGFPDDVPLPDDFEIEAAMSMGTADNQTFTVRMTSPDADVDQTFEDLKSRSEAAGFEVLSSNTMSGDGHELRSATMSNSDWNASISVSGEADGTSVQYTLLTPDESQ